MKGTERVPQNVLYYMICILKFIFLVDATFGASMYKFEPIGIWDLRCFLFA